MEGLGDESRDAFVVEVFEGLGCVHGISITLHERTKYCKTMIKEKVRITKVISVISRLQ